MRTYESIGSFRLLDIEVILNDTNVIYTVKVEDTPEEIKKLKYSKVEMGTSMKLYVYD